VLSLNSRATESVFSSGNQYSIMNYQKNIYEVTFTLDASTPFTLTMASPIYAQGTCTLTSPTNTVQSFSANTSLLYSLNLTPGQWKFAANTIVDDGPPGDGPVLIGATLAVAPEPSSAVMLAIASAGMALQRRRVGNAHT
jgi:hypothetical protein